MAADERIIPAMHPLQFQNPAISKKITFLLGQIDDAKNKFKALLARVEQQSNASNIPGLSQPTAMPNQF